MNLSLGTLTRFEIARRMECTTSTMYFVGVSRLYTARCVAEAPKRSITTSPFRMLISQSEVSLRDTDTLFSCQRAGEQYSTIVLQRHWATKKQRRRRAGRPPNEFFLISSFANLPIFSISSPATHHASLISNTIDVYDVNTYGGV
jgi:hypothetical protein